MYTHGSMGKRIRQNEKNACLFNSYRVGENALVHPLSGFHFLYAFILRISYDAMARYYIFFFSCFFLLLHNQKWIV